MNVESEVDIAAAAIAAAIGEPARARMLYCLVDNRARTSTELAVVADVGPSTASVHLTRLAAERLVKVAAQGRHRYYSLNGPVVARVLEGLSVLAGAANGKFVPSTPNHLRAGRTCYDHIAGNLGVSLHDRMIATGWIKLCSSNSNSYELTVNGRDALQRIGIDVEGLHQPRRRVAFGCLDWSERRCHIGGALGAALLNMAFKRGWVLRHLDSRALEITRVGHREILRHFSIQV